MSLSKASVLWLLVCVIGCCYQITILTIGYAKYEISSDVKLTFEEEIQLPAVTWCMALHYAMNWSHEIANKGCSRIMGVDCSDKTTEQLMKISQGMNNIEANAIDDRIFETFDGQEMMDVTVGAESMVHAVLYVNGSVRPESLITSRLQDAPFEVTEAIRFTGKCFTLKWKPPFDRMSSVVMRKGRFSPGVFLILMYTPDFLNRTTWYEFAYSNNRMPILRQGIVDFMATGTAGVTVSSYELFKSQLMEAPFTTNCFEYREIGFVDQAECYDLCIEDKAVRTFNKKWPGLRVDRKDVGIKVMTNPEILRNEKQYLDLVSRCQTTCAKQDCIQDVYASSLRTSNTPISIISKSHVSFISNTPTVVTQASAKTTLTEYLVVSASCFGFWFGLSVLQSLEFVRSIFRFRKRKERRVRREHRGRTPRNRPPVTIPRTNWWADSERTTRRRPPSASPPIFLHQF